MKHGLLVMSGVALSLVTLALAFADDPPPQPPPPVFYVSMRNLTAENAPSFVVVKKQADATHTVAVTGCNGRTYYATSADAATINAARTGGELVQLHRGQPNQPQSSAVMCILDGAGGG